MHRPVYTTRGLCIPTPFHLAPINTGFFKNGLPCEGMHQFHLARSGNSIGISYVGNVAIDKKYVTSSSTAYLTPDSSWETIANSIAGNGSLPGIQLACKTFARPAQKKWVNSDINEYVISARRHVTSLDAGEIDRIIDKFTQCVKIAFNCGFRVIQLHAAHGYFLSLLISSHFNQRRDAHGDRTHTLRRLISAIRALALPIAIDVRISLAEGVRDRELEITDFHNLAALIADMDIDIISLSDGLYDIDKYQIYPRPDKGNACNLHYGAFCANIFPGKLWNVAGNIWEINSISSQLTSNLSISIGRALIADPQFVKKSLQGEKDSINKCTRSGHCHYYSRSRPHIECHVNDNVASNLIYQLPVINPK